MSFIKSEPVAVVSSITGAVSAVISAGVLLGAWHFTVDQAAAVVLAVQAVLAVPLTVIVRSAVTPNVNVAAEANRLVAADAGHGASAGAPPADILPS